MKINLFRYENGRWMVNLSGILKLYLLVPLVLFAGWVAMAFALTGDWTWNWLLGIAFSFIGPSFIVGNQLINARR